MSEYRVTLCDHPDCTEPATRRLELGPLTPPSVGPLLVPAAENDPAAGSTDVCDAHAHELVVDVYGLRWFWPSEPVPMRRLAVLQGGRGTDRK